MFNELNKSIDIIVNKLEEENLLHPKKIKDDRFLSIINESPYLITLHNVEQFRPICLNNNFLEFYGFKKNWLAKLDYVYYLTTIHKSTYHTLISSLEFFKKGGDGYLNLTYILKSNSKKWETVNGTTRTIIKKENGKPQYAITVAKVSEKGIEKTTYDTNKKRIKNLSAREKEIVFHLINGLTRKEVSTKLNIAESTVGSHTKTIYKKLNINKISQLVVLFEKHSL